MSSFFTKAVQSIITFFQPYGSSGSVWRWRLNNTAIHYESEVRADSSSIVIACVRWVQRVSSEAPPILETWNAERQGWDEHLRAPILDLLERPNPYYNGITLWKATVADLMLSGTSYWAKVRNMEGQVLQLWWIPSHLITPIGDETTFISHYEYRPGSNSMIKVRETDIVQFRDGIDPADPRVGLSPLRSLFREIFTDDEAANMTASLLRNMGVPGVVISPTAGNITESAAQGIKTAFMQKFTGDRRGEPLVMEGGTKIESFGFSPEQMQLRSLRGIPEERITAVLGVNAAVVGLGAGLATTKVGATLREYREEAFESTIIPLYRELSSELTHQLLNDFTTSKNVRLSFDLTKVRVLQDDENLRSSRLNGMLASGGITVAEYRRALGLVTTPDHEFYLRSTGTIAVPVGEETTTLLPGQEPPGAAPSPPQEPGQLPEPQQNSAPQSVEVGSTAHLRRLINGL